MLGLNVDTHHERVNEKIIVLERIESRGGVDAILVGLAELQNNHHRC